ncbi:hypothetical protein D3C72_2137790 [compost metagenome]
MTTARKYPTYPMNPSPAVTSQSFKRRFRQESLFTTRITTPINPEIMNLHAARSKIEYSPINKGATKFIDQAKAANVAAAIPAVETCFSAEPLIHFSL